MAELTLTEDEIAEHAERIADEVLQDLEYSYVYEDEDLQDATEADWLAVHAKIQSLVSVDPAVFEE